MHDYLSSTDTLQRTFRQHCRWRWVFWNKTPCGAVIYRRRCRVPGFLHI